MDLKTSLLFGYQSARSAHFIGQQMTLPLLERIFLRSKREAPDNLIQLRRDLMSELANLFHRDSQNIARGLYPAEVLIPESPLKHWLRFGRIILDGVQLAKRRKEHTAHEFDLEAQSYFDDVPEYYRRNFHYQTGGYLSEHSADLYEHQVDILFAGGADAMRRLLIAPLKERFPGDGEGLKFLEVGAGTGRLTRFMKLAFPKARIIVTDLSWPYLKAAQKQLSSFDRLDFLQAAGEKLPFEGEQFDAVYSCFLFHELPREVRSLVIREANRVLKSGGAFGMVDALQKGNDSRFDDALERFPRDFHEPFFKNYMLHPIEDILIDEGFRGLVKNQGLLSKALVAEKSQNN